MPVISIQFLFWKQPIGQASTHRLQPIHLKYTGFTCLCHRKEICFMALRGHASRHFPHDMQFRDEKSGFSANFSI